MQTISCLLILTSQPEAPPGTVTQVNITVTPASHNADVKELQVFSLTVTVESRGLGTTEDLKNENKFAVWKIVVISASSGLLLFLNIALVVFKVRHGSYDPRKPPENKTRNESRGISSNQPLQLQKINEGYDCDIA